MSVETVPFSHLVGIVSEGLEIAFPYCEWFKFIFSFLFLVEHFFSGIRCCPDTCNKHPSSNGEYITCDNLIIYNTTELILVLSLAYNSWNMKYENAQKHLSRRKLMFIIYFR